VDSRPKSFPPPGRAARRILEQNALGLQLVANAIRRREVAVLLRFRTLCDALLNLGWIWSNSSIENRAWSYARWQSAPKPVLRFVIQ